MSTNEDGYPEGAIVLGFSPFAGIVDPLKRAFLEAFAETGQLGLAAERAVMNPATIYTASWENDAQFQEAFYLAKRIAAEQLADVARSRAVDGVRSYKFTKDGSPLRHPEQCECGHHVRRHEKRWDPDSETDLVRGGCSDCTCERYHGAPYYEHAYSDKLLEFLLKGQLPAIYGDRMRVENAIANLDVSRLPDELVARIAAGEPVMQVLASAALSHAEVRALVGEVGGGEGQEADEQEPPADD